MKVKCIKSEYCWIREGKTYDVIDGKVITEEGYCNVPLEKFKGSGIILEEIEDTFEANGKTWFKGEPPKHPGLLVILLSDAYEISEPYTIGSYKYNSISLSRINSGMDEDYEIIGWRYAEETVTGTVTDDGLEIEVEDISEQRQMVAMDDNPGESEGERKYREKQEALRSEEAKNELERLRRNEKAAKVFVTDYTDGNHRHKFGMFGGY